MTAVIAPRARGEDHGGVRLQALLLPEPPRRVRGHRALSIALRTAHLAAFGILLGGHVFDVPETRLVTALAATVASGVGLMLVELAATCAWLGTVKGLAVLGKLGLLLLVPVLWDHRVPLLLAVLVLASVAAHMPARVRHRVLLRW